MTVEVEVRMAVIRARVEITTLPLGKTLPRDRQTPLTVIASVCGCICKGLGLCGAHGVRLWSRKAFVRL